MATYSTYATAKAAFFDNSDYDDGEGSIAKARNFKNAIRSLLILQPKRASQSGASTEFESEMLKAESERVTNWLDARETAGTRSETTLADFSDFRRG
jgi:hypothetical protein